MTEPKNKRSSYTREDLQACGIGALFGPETAKLPKGNMLMIDRIIDINSDGGEHGKGSITAELDIDPDLWFFGCHFEGDPVMPGCLGLDALWQLCGFFLAWSGCKGKGRALYALLNPALPELSSGDPVAAEAPPVADPQPGAEAIVRGYGAAWRTNDPVALARLFREDGTLCGPEVPRPLARTELAHHLGTLHQVVAEPEAARLHVKLGAVGKHISGVAARAYDVRKLVTATPGSTSPSTKDASPK